MILHSDGELFGRVEEYILSKSVTVELEDRRFKPHWKLGRAQDRLQRLLYV